MQIPHLPEEVKELYKCCGNGNRKATVPELKEVLKHLAVVKDLDDIFIIVDALDECPHDEVHGLREEALNLVGEFETWSASKIHLLITSRRELDIEQRLTPLLGIPPIPLEGYQIDSDIELHINEQLSTDQKLKRWPPQIKLQIEETLAAQADGM
jgi:ankyrin repeat domain-containing protein 50